MRAPSQAPRACGSGASTCVLGRRRRRDRPARSCLRRGRGRLRANPRRLDRHTRGRDRVRRCGGLRGRGLREPRCRAGPTRTTSTEPRTSRSTRATVTLIPKGLSSAADASFSTARVAGSEYFASASVPRRRSTLHAIDAAPGTAWSKGSFGRMRMVSPSSGVKSKEAVRSVVEMRQDRVRQRPGEPHPAHLTRGLVEIERRVGDERVVVEEAGALHDAVLGVAQHARAAFPLRDDAGSARRNRARAPRPPRALDRPAPPPPPRGPRP